jgi:oligopeptide transport system substrate-binding protein
VGLSAFALASALVLTACGGGGGEEPPAEGTSTGIVTVGNGEPQNPLIPARTNEVFGGLVVTNIFAGLSYYDAEGAVHNEVAESIESEDNQTWTVTLQDGWEFSDGTPVTASSFVDAWNWAAYGPNGANLASFFSSIEGFGEAQGEYEIDDEGNVKVLTEPETEFTIKLAQPESDFPIRLGYAAYYPLPEVFFDDPEAFGEKPVGNGPYVLESWEHDSAINLVPNDSYDGDRKAQNGGIELVAYTDEDAQYNDLLSGNLDIVQNVPASAFATFEDELGDRAVNQPSATLGAMAVPEWVEEFSGEAGLMRRHALSMAINREQITETIYAGARTPAGATPSRAASTSTTTPRRPRSSGTRPSRWSPGATRSSRSTPTPTPTTRSGSRRSATATRTTSASSARWSATRRSTSSSTSVTRARAARSTVCSAPAGPLTTRPCRTTSARSTPRRRSRARTTPST